MTQSADFTDPKEFTIDKGNGGYNLVWVDPEIVDQFKGEKRLLCRLNGEVLLHCALQYKKDRGHFIYMGKKVMKQLGVEQITKVTVEFSKDESEYQFEFPEELKEVLATDEEANEIFNSLTPGNQRSLIHLVRAVKSVDKRIERALRIAERLKQGITQARFVMKKE